MTRKRAFHFYTLLLLTFLFGCTGGKRLVHMQDIDYSDGMESFDINPARGEASRGPWVVFRPEGLPDWHGEGGFHSTLWELSLFSGGRIQDGQRPSAERVGEADIPLTEAMTSDVRRFLDETRSQGGSLIVRIAYTGTEQTGCEPADFNILLQHVETLSQIMSGYDDVIVAIEAGIIGPWGEMHSSDYTQKEYASRILQAFLDNLPPTISILVRRPFFIEMMADKSGQELMESLPFEDVNLQRFGVFNDGYLGTREDWGTWWDFYNREKGCRLLTKMEDHPYGGEMAYCDRQWLDEHNEIFNPSEWNLVKEFYDTHLSYLRNIQQKRHTIANFLHNDLTFDTATYHFDGMPQLGEYQGQSMGKLMLDHMGYRFVVRDICTQALPATGQDCIMRIKLENTGFGKLLFPTEAALLFVDEKGMTNVPVQLPLDMRGGESKTVELCFQIPATLPEGNYHLYLHIWAPLDGEGADRETHLRPIRFANKNMWDDTLKANAIGIIKIKNAR